MQNTLATRFKKTLKNKPQELVPICEFAEKWCDISPLVSQRVLLKIYAGEPLLDYPVYDNEGILQLVSEQEWFDTMYRKGYFPPGVYESVQRGEGFQDILLVVGRRGGKSTMIAVAALYTVYKTLQHDNPQRYYGIQEGSVIEVSVAAKTGKQAERAPFSKIRQICEAAIVKGLPLSHYIEDIFAQTIFFLTEEDRRRKEALLARGIRRQQNHGTIRIEAYNSNTDSFRGGAVIAAIMDEFAQYAIHKLTGEDAAEYFYETLVPSVHQFKEDGRVFILSTPQGKQGKFYDLYQELFEEEADSNTIGMKMPVWESWYGMPDTNKGKVSLESLADDKRIPFRWDYNGKNTESGEPENVDEALAKAPASFKREYGAEFEGSEDQWIPEVLIYNPTNPEQSFRYPGLEKQTQGAMGRVYVAHADPARTHDGFAFALGHKETHPKRGEEVIIDLAHRWIVKPGPNYRSPGPEHETVITQTTNEPAHIPFREVRKWIERTILLRFGVRLLTMDQWNSQLMIEDLAYFMHNRSLNTGIELLNFTAPLNKEKDDHFQQLLLEHRIKCYHQPVLERELLSLTKDKFGRVQAMAGEHDDLYDCISVVALKAMELPELQDSSKSGNPFNIDPVFIEQRF